MVTVHKISEDLIIDPFELVALHATMESYAVAYHINKMAHVTLTRTEEDLNIGEYRYPMFEHKDELKGEEWYLVDNKFSEEREEIGTGLFQSSRAVTTRYLLSERREINYILKLYLEEQNTINEIIETLRTIPKISMVYSLDVTKLKSRQNLIF